MTEELPEPAWFSHRDEASRREYAERFTRIAATGRDVDGEARFVDAMAGRGSTILDAGCGAGRVAAALALRGHRAHGVDVDPILVEHGRALTPDVPLVVLDLAALSPEALSERGLPTAYDVIVSAGNVMHYVGEGTQPRIVANLAGVLASGGRLVVGFRTRDRFTHDDLDRLAEASGLTREHRFADWEMRPFNDAADWATSVYCAVGS